MIFGGCEGWGGGDGLQLKAFCANVLQTTCRDDLTNLTNKSRRVRITMKAAGTCARL
jgi:hypothetical protein